jgi:hypothetical protein
VQHDILRQCATVVLFRGKQLAASFDIPYTALPDFIQQLRGGPCRT